MRGRGHLRSLTVFVRHENVVRLLQHFAVKLTQVALLSQMQPLRCPLSSCRGLL
jgi:hypothetical protein